MKSKGYYSKAMINIQLETCKFQPAQCTHVQCILPTRDVWCTEFNSKIYHKLHSFWWIMDIICL